MNEGGYIRAIHRHLPMDVYRWKISDRFTAGIPDTYYSGNLSDLWVEYKYEPYTPKIIAPKLSDRQRHWLNSRLAQGRNVLVILGTPKGGFILSRGAWNVPVEASSLKLRSKKEIAAWIAESTMGQS